VNSIRTISLSFFIGSLGAWKGCTNGESDWATR
jgi:hypothetical protein